MDVSTVFDLGQRVRANEGSGVITRIEVDIMDGNIIEGYEASMDGSDEVGQYFDFQLEAE